MDASSNRARRLPATSRTGNANHQHRGLPPPRLGHGQPNLARHGNGIGRPAPTASSRRNLVSPDPDNHRRTGRNHLRVSYRGPHDLARLERSGLSPPGRATEMAPARRLSTRRAAPYSPSNRDHHLPPRKQNPHWPRTGRSTLPALRRLHRGTVRAVTTLRVASPGLRLVRRSRCKGQRPQDRRPRT